MKKIFFSCILFIGLIACQQQEKPAVAFYYWKTVFRLSPIEKNTLAENQVKKLYLRYFDIDLHHKTKEPFPESPIHFEQLPTGFIIVPVVYIKNNVMLSKELDVEDLAKKINHFIGQINTKNNISCQEIQIDCDWTLASRDNYLKFVNVFKTVSGKKLSATIRLHQIKYFEKTKIPDVDRGVLMYYNMGKIAPDSLNSIYDRDIASRYLESLRKYPLSIDVALPIYSWAIHIRDGKVMGLKTKLEVPELRKDTNFVQAGKNQFRVKQSNYRKGTFYKRNDILKIETVLSDDLMEMANDLEENIVTGPKEIIFYDLDEFNIKPYEKDIFKQVTSRF